ncbi:MAG: NfeD family protein [Lachnospiraceae bacterium]|nr:NfeD family protein [Lachnospiraceae bacterium]
MEPVYVWLIALIAFVVIEIATMGLTTIWFAGGALVALVLAMFNTSFYVQLGAFLVISIILLVGTRPLAIKFFNQKREKTNVDSMIGKQAIVVAEIDNLREEGQVILNGMEWSARAYEEGKIIPTGAVVEVKEIRGVKLMVVEKGKEQ